ncbi:MAG: hypothetical protein SFW08_03745 [Gemmatimonadaceae bacterium]|nr:hypothetical protein [Gemmatimonadaceae bacterium]
MRARAVVVGVCGVVGLVLGATTVPAQSGSRGASRPAASAPRAPATVPATWSADSAMRGALRWRHVGPVRGGRVTTVTGVVQDPTTFFFGSTGGGVWKTTDAGLTWKNVSDGAFACASMGALDVSDSDPTVIWAGTGSDGIRSNVSIGCGVYRSRDGGASWTFAGLRDAGQIGALVVHPTRPDVAWVAAIGDPFKPTPTRGVFRTTDGGATWTKSLFVSDSTGAVDLELKPDDPNTIYAVMWRGERKPWTIISGATEGGVYKSIDGGATWAKLGGGLPTGLWGKGDLAVSSAQPNRVYLLLEAQPGQGLWRSDDAGLTWSLVSTQNGLLNRPFYYTNVDADPQSADVVYVSNESFFRSTDGGKTFRVRPTPHGDNHDLWIHPRNSRLMIGSNDGGAAVSFNGGDTWTTQYNQPTAEIYQVAVDDQWPYRIYGAQQDQSATHVIPSLPLTAAAPDDPLMQWAPVGGCETGPVVPSPKNPDVIFTACKGQFSRFDRRTGQEQAYWIGAQSLYGHDPKDLVYRFQRVSPLVVSPHEPQTVYYASQYVHRTRDEGRTWERISPDLTAFDPKTQGVSGTPITRDVTGEEFYSALYAVAESPRERGVIWAGANDGPISVTRDDGRSWTRVTPPDLPPGGRVQTIALSPHRNGAAYVAVLRHLLGDYTPYLYATNDYGRTWRRITNGIPADHPTRVIREDPQRPGLLYAGTEFGFFVSFNDGATWRPFQLNLPVVPITDLVVHRHDLVISTQGRGHWILDDITPLREVSAATLADAPTLFAPREAIRWRYDRYPLEPAYPEMPPVGATLTYRLPSAARSLALTIRDSAGRLVRQFTAGVPDSGARDAQSAMHRPPPPARPGAPTLPLAAGIHRVRWDLTHYGATDESGAPSERGGPMVGPGRYAIELKVDGTVLRTRLDVRVDPRATAVGIRTSDLREQETLALRVRDAVSAARQLTGTLRATRDARRAANDTAGVAAATVLLAALETAPGRYQQPMLTAQLQYLYGMLVQADQRPGRDAGERFATLSKELTVLARRAEALR